MWLDCTPTWARLIMYLFLVKRAADDAGSEIEKKKPRLEVKLIVEVTMQSYNALIPFFNVILHL